MIRFDGALTDDAKEHFMKKMINKACIFGFLATLLCIPIFGVFFAGTNVAKYVIPVTLVLSAIGMYISKLIISKSKKTNDHENIKKVIIKDDVIKIISEESLTKKKY